MSNISDYDKDCNEVIQESLHPYFDGEISLDEAINNFYSKIESLHPELSY